MKRSCTFLANRLDALGESDAFVKCALCFVVICLATAGAALIGMCFSVAVAKVLAIVTASITLLGCIALYPHLWDIAGPQIPGHPATPSPKPLPKARVSY